MDRLTRGGRYGEDIEMTPAQLSVAFFLQMAVIIAACASWGGWPNGIWASPRWWAR